MNIKAHPEDLRKFTDPEVFREAERRARAFAEIKTVEAKNKEGYACNCAKCGVSTTVPFKPSPGYPVYCRDCYMEKKEAGK